MINKLARRLTASIINGGANEAKREIYTYGAECFISELISDLLIILVAMFLNILIPSLIWLIFFTSLRVYLGGIHANSHFSCIVSSLIICLISSYISWNYMISKPAIIALSVICFLLVLIISPIIHPNHPVSDLRKKTVRKNSIIIAFLETVLIMIFAYCISDIRFSMIMLVSECGVVILGTISFLQIGLKKIFK